MWERLKQLNHRYDELQAQLSAPETYGDPGLVAKLSRQQRELESVVECARALDHCREELNQARELTSDPDPEVRRLAREEAAEIKEHLTELETKLKELLVPRDPEDEKDVILEIRAGVGGEEATLFAQSLLRMYMMLADRKGWKLEVDCVSTTELGGVKEALCAVRGTDVYGALKFESGVHRVQRVPVTESGGRIHTSTATVAVLPEVDEVEFELDLSQVRIDTFRASGAGGQHINKTESAIRVTHIPTGTVVECQDQRSQYKNKDRALSILRARLYQLCREEQLQAISGQRRAQVGTGMRNERIRTYNFPQGRVTDHRIGLTLYQIDQVMDGALEEILDALSAAHRADRLRIETGGEEEK